MADHLSFFVCDSHGSRFLVKFPPEDTVASVRRQLEATLNLPGHIRLFWGEDELRSHLRIEQYDLLPDTVLTMQLAGLGCAEGKPFISG
jgi:hypothetical protein